MNEHVANPAPPRDLGTRQQHRFEIEDVLLAVWLGVLEPCIRWYTGDDLLPLLETLDLRLMESTWDTRWAWVAQPGVAMGAVLCIILVPLATVVLTPRWPSAARRTLVVPAALLGASLCRDVTRAASQDGDHGVTTLAAIHLVGSLLPFLLLVAAPRIIAGATSDWRRWVPRFALFAAAWLAGALVRW